jgi:hypothetical protein
MVLLGDMRPMEAHQGLFGDSVNLSTPNGTPRSHVSSGSSFHFVWR